MMKRTVLCHIHKSQIDRQRPLNSPQNRVEFHSRCWTKPQARTDLTRIFPSFPSQFLYSNRMFCPR